MSSNKTKQRKRQKRRDAVALYTGAQLRQAMEACAVACDYEFQAHKAIKELIKEML